MEFSHGGKSYKFNLNPDEYSVSEPNRLTVTQTLGGAWVDSFGAGLKEITLKGTTGLNNAKGNNLTGINKFKELRELIRDVYSTENNLRDVRELTPMSLYNYTDGDYFKVLPTTFNLSRNKNNPLLFMYDIKLVVMGNLNDSYSSGNSVGTVGLSKGIMGEGVPGMISGSIQMSNPVPGITGFSIIKADAPMSNLYNPVKKEPFTSSFLSNLSGSASVNLSNDGVSAGLGVGGFDIGLSKDGVSVDGNINLDADFLGEFGSIYSSMSVSTGVNGNGKLSPVSFSSSSSSLSIMASGYVNNFPGVNLGMGLSRAYEDLSLKAFVPVVNPKVLELQQKFESGDFSILDVSSYMKPSGNSAVDVSKIVSDYGSKTDCTLLDALVVDADALSHTDVLRVKLIALEAMSYPSAIIGRLSGIEVMKISMTDVERLINNLDVTLDSIESKDNPPISTIRELRKIDLQIKSLVKMGFWGEKN